MSCHYVYFPVGVGVDINKDVYDLRSGEHDTTSDPLSPDRSDGVCATTIK